MTNPANVEWKELKRRSKRRSFCSLKVRIDYEPLATRTDAMANPIAVFMFHVSCCFFCLGVGWLAPLLGVDEGRKLARTEKKRKRRA